MSFQPVLAMMNNEYEYFYISGSGDLPTNSPSEKYTVTPRTYYSILETHLILAVLKTGFLLEGMQLRKNV